jgi:type I site-specific restriction-modification system R (restriction) subunit
MGSPKNLWKPKAKCDSYYKIVIYCTKSLTGDVGGIFQVSGH